MRRLLSGFAAACLLSHSAFAAAPPRCATPTEQSMFEMAALKSELMVLATGCQRGNEYNAFVQRYRPQLVELDRNLVAHFRRVHGARGQTEADRFATELANAQSSVANTHGGDFCARNGLVFSEVMALSGPADLPAYAAGKNVIPATLTTCAPARAAATARTVSTRPTSAKPAARATTPARR